MRAGSVHRAVDGCWFVSLWAVLSCRSVCYVIQVYWVYNEALVCHLRTSEYKLSTGKNIFKCFKLKNKEKTNLSSSALGIVKEGVAIWAQRYVITPNPSIVLFLTFCGHLVNISSFPWGDKEQELFCFLQIDEVLRFREPGSALKGHAVHRMAFFYLKGTYGFLKKSIAFKECRILVTQFWYFANPGMKNKPCGPCINGDKEQINANWTCQNLKI